MKTYIRCKACGFVMDESHLKDVCPACGLPKTVFEPYTKKISPNRKFLIDQHIHPIAVHFPQVFITVVPLLLLLSFVVADPWKNDFLAASKLSILALPFSVFIGFVSGLFDGKLRFRKVTTPLLINKIIAGIALQILSAVVFVLYLFNGFTATNIIAITVLSVICMALAIYLGRAGSSMFDSIMPG